MGVSSGGCFAWYTADAAATIKKSTQSMTATVDGGHATMSAGNFYLKLTLTPHEWDTDHAEVSMTSSDGETYGIDGLGKLRKCDKSKTTNVNYFELTATWSSTESTQTNLTPAERVSIPASTAETELKFTIGHADTSTGRVRLGVTNSPAVSATTLRANAYVKVSWAAGTSGADPAPSFKVSADDNTYSNYAADGYRICFSIAGQLAVSGDDAKTGGTGLSVGDDLSSTFLDTNYVGNDATEDSSLGTKLQITVS